MSTASVRFRPRQGEKDGSRSSAQHIRASLDRWAKQIPSLFSKFRPHLAIIVLAVLVFSIGQFKFPLEYELPSRATPTIAPSLGLRGFQPSASGRGGQRLSAEMDEPAVRPTAAGPAPARPSVSRMVVNALFQSPVVHTTIPDRPRRDVITYTVQKGDTLLEIATEFNLEEETLMWANVALERNPDLLRPGQELVVLPIDGVYHTVEKGDTVQSIAKKYKAEVADIIQCEYNNLDAENPQITSGDKLIVPGGVKPNVTRYVTAYNGPIPADAKHGSGIFDWPAAGTLTDRFGFRTFSGRWHSGLDISGYRGADILAADSGFVTYAGWTKTGYGNLVIIDHQNGFETYYAHLNSVLVVAGQSVSKGQLIATMGSTGNSSGPHLHFEVREKGARKNPELYLP